MQQLQKRLTKKLWKGLLTAAIGPSLATGFGSVAQAATIEVVAGEVADLDNGQCSIVEAMINANNDDQSGSSDCVAGNADDTLVLPTDSEFRFVTTDLGSGRALPEVTSAITIQGNGSTLLRDESAASLFGLIEVAIDGELSLSGVTVANGRVPPGFSGGGIVNFGVLEMTDSVVTGNSAGTAGGGISNRGTIVLNRTTVTGNTARFDGGGIAISAGEVRVTDSDIIGNIAGRRGGGINLSSGTLHIFGSYVGDNTAEDGGGVSGRRTVVPLAIELRGSTVSNNMANTGGGIRLEASGTDPDVASLSIVESTLDNNTAMTESGGALEILGPFTDVIISNSTFSGNVASSGGGISHSEGTLDVEHATFANNSANDAGDDLFWQDAQRGALGLRSSILASEPNNVSCSVVNGDLTGNLNNLIIDGSCAGNAIDPVMGDPLLGPLASNNGPTQTHELLAGSVAIDAAAQLFCPATDQRGMARSDGACDIGAFEFVPLGELIFGDGFEQSL